jgi:hypothetical protein
MESIYVKQAELGTEITKLVSNTKKDSQSRKNQQYIRDRQEKLEEYWAKFLNNHEKLLEGGITKEKYFETKYYDQVFKTYIEGKTLLEEYGRVLKRGKAPKVKEIQIRKQRIEELLRPENEQDLQEDEELQSELREYMEKVNTLMIEAAVNEELDATDNGEVERINHLKRKVREVLKKIRPGMQRPESTQRRDGVTLPQVKIPVYEGRYETWRTFHDLFTKVIHENDQLSNAEKMQYLKTQVRGEANRMIQHLNISEANYEVAWNMLKDRYENPRMILFKLIDRMLLAQEVKESSARALKSLHDTFHESLEAIGGLGTDTEAWSPLIARIIITKWDNETRRLYENHIGDSREIPTYKSTQTFLQRRFQTLELLESEKRQEKQGGSLRKPRTHCVICNGDHGVPNCREFQELNVRDRNRMIKEKGLCTNCLAHKKEKQCYSQYRCRHCGGDHHHMLHYEKGNTSNKRNSNGTKGEQTQERNGRDSNNRRNGYQADRYRGGNNNPYNAREQNNGRRENTQDTNGPRNSNDQQRGQNSVNCASHKEGEALLATAVVRIRDAKGDSHIMRALIDQGSQCAFITEQAATTLGTTRKPIQATISGIGSSGEKTANWSMKLLIETHYESDFEMEIEALVLPKITRNLPEKDIILPDYNEKNAILADPRYYKVGKIDLLLGVKEYSYILTEGMHRISNGLLSQNTKLGWIVSGIARERENIKAEVCCMISRQEMDVQIKNFWELEEVNQDTSFSVEEQECEELYRQTVKRNEEGRYEVKIPFREDVAKLGESKQQAFARLMQLERKFAKDKQLEANYRQFMEDYENQGHMVIAENQGDGYYLPHHPVRKEDSTTTKIRAVFDASSKSSSAVSLNDIMHTGPKLQQDLTNILLRWRSNKVAYSADLEKMFRQIRMAEEDQKYQKILWRKDTKDHIQEYNLTTVTYGTAAAPFLALRTIQQLQEDEGARFPLASKIVKENMYVDDILGGAETVQEAETAQKELIQLFRKGGFILRKWLSNEEKIMENVPEDMRNVDSKAFKQEEVRKTLGIHWSPKEDIITFKIGITTAKKITKRHVLSEVAKLYDPLGWIAPVVIQAKMFIQELWEQKTSWDKELTSNQQSRWNTYQAQLVNLEKITLPRWNNLSKINRVELHGFADASMKGYGAVIYSRVLGPEIKTNLMIAKSKVAPLKGKTTLPRLELCAAVLLANLMKKTLQALNRENIEVYAWSDSTITLAWIRGSSKRWKMFVANRVEEIRRVIGPKNWHKVDTKENPADILSRGSTASELLEAELWWKGPTWLTSNKTLTQESEEIPETNEEEVKTKITVHTTTIKEDICERFSNLERMRRVLSYCRRFADKCRKKKDNGQSQLTVQELEETLLKVIKHTQHAYFKQEINKLEKKQQLDKKNKLASLVPFLDRQGILRVTGRLRHTNLKYGEKHPIILPKDSALTKLLITDSHARNLHSGLQQTLQYIKRKYWIINGRRTVKDHLAKCLRCRRYKSQAAQQLMGDLPKDRVNPSHPFTNTGIDYAGPIKISTTRGRGQRSYKGYISVFVCLSTKAVHLEVVSDMSTDAFIAAFKRFTARRGQCNNVYSDNGTTFVGTANLLKKENQKIDDEIKQGLLALGTQWHVIPAYAPHFGGLWESAVRIMKYHLKRIIGETVLTYEELSTVLAQIEACMNSRPLCGSSEDPEGKIALTPAHFLIGREIISPNREEELTTYLKMPTRWRLVEKIKRDFWKIWKQEYLHQLQQRNRWHKAHPNIKEEEIVIIKEEDTPPGRWPLARVTETHPGAEGLTRVVTVRKANGKLTKRPIHKLIRLEEEKQEKPKKAAALRWKKILVAIMFLTMLKPIKAEPYKIYNPVPGFFTEDLGEVVIDRGTFRIKVLLEKGRIRTEHQLIGNMIQGVRELCHEIKIVNCKDIIEKLEEGQRKAESVSEGLTVEIKGRERRGILGTILTSVFGVNDEAYSNIEALDNNQKELIKGSQHQAKIMLETITSINHTENRINEQMNKFNKALITGLQEISKGLNEVEDKAQKLETEYSTLRIQTIALQVMDFINEYTQFYEGILNLHYNHGHFIDIVKPGEITKLIGKAGQILPQGVEIRRQPIIETEVSHDDRYITVIGYFIVTGKNKYSMLKVTAIPLNVEGSVLRTFVAPRNLLVVDYNTLHYFELTAEDRERCLLLTKAQIACSPTAIRNMDTQPNCILEEIYERSKNSTCPVVARTIQTAQWSKMGTPNLWLVITPVTIHISIICDGNRSERVLERVTFLKLSPKCIAQTKNITLLPTSSGVDRAVTSYLKSPITPVAQLVARTPRKFNTPLNTYLDIPGGELRHVLLEEESLEQEMTHTQWRSIHESNWHYFVATGIITIMVIIGILTLWKYRPVARLCRSGNPQTQTNEQEVPVLVSNRHNNVRSTSQVDIPLSTFSSNCPNFNLEIESDIDS